MSVSVHTGKSIIFTPELFILTIKWIFFYIISFLVLVTFHGIYHLIQF